MALHRYERQTIYWMALIVALGTILFGWYFATVANPRPEVPLRQIDAAPQQVKAVTIIAETAAVAQERSAEIIPVAFVQASEAPTTYHFPIPAGHTLTRIEAETCNRIDDVIRLNQGNPAIKSRDTIIAGGVITLIKVEPCSPVMAKAQKAFPENSPRVANRGGSPEASLATGPRGRHARTQRTERSAPATDEGPIEQHVGMSRRQMQELAKDNCAAAGWGHKRSSESWVVSIADCIEAKWGGVIRSALREQQAQGVITDADLEPHARRFIALLIVESSGNPLAKSKPLAPGRDPCYGLAQIQPGTGRDFGLPFKEIYNPHKNILTGVRVLYNYAGKFGGSIVHGLVAYNIGTGNEAWNFKNYHRRVERLEIPYARDVERTRLVLERAAFERKSKELEPLLEDNPA